MDRVRLFAAAALLVGVASGLAVAAEAAPPETVTVTTTESKFTPDKLVFRRGVNYRLHLVNRGNEMHEFNAAEFFKSADIGNPEALNTDKTELVVHPGESKDLAFTPKRTGHFPLVCPDHDWDGMTGEIIVE